MKRWLAREALLGSAALFATLGTGCKPDNSVKPGAPVLTELIIAAGGSATRVLPNTSDCATGVADASPCSPSVQEPAIPDTLCRHEATSNWCSCVPDATDMTMGAWSCAPFGPVASVIAIFDRVIDTSDFDPMTTEAPGAATLELPPGAPTASLATDYAANGSTIGLIFPLLGNFVIGNFRVNGPSLLMMGNPALPSNTVVTVSLSKTAVRAKDGKTAFTGEGLLQDGTISFLTGPFGASVTVPAGMDADGGVAPAAPDMTPVNLAFTNVVDAAAILSHITVTSGGTPVPFSLDPATGPGVSFNIVPTANWPANATITVTLDATTPDVLNETLGAAVTESFMTGAP